MLRCLPKVDRREGIFWLLAKGFGVKLAGMSFLCLPKPRRALLYCFPFPGKSHIPSLLREWVFYPLSLCLGVVPIYD